MVTLAPEHFRHRDAIMAQIEAFFPDHKVALLAEGIALSVQREEAGVPMSTDFPGHPRGSGDTITVVP